MSDSRSRADGPRRRRGAVRTTDAGASPPARPDDVPIRTPATPAADVAPSADVIRMRAYELYLARNGSPGSDVEDWLAAERALGGGGDDGARPLNG